MDLLQCHCGGVPEVTEGTNRMQKRKEAADAIAALAGNPKATLRQRQQADIVKNALELDVEEVHCPKCGAWCHGGPAEDVRNLWNKAITKLAELKDCCRASEDVRVDYDGQVMVRCNTCHTRHLPLGTR